MSNRCTMCNAELVPNAPFCTSCGARVTGTPATGPTVTLPVLPPEAQQPSEPNTSHSEPNTSRSGDPVWSPAAPSEPNTSRSGDPVWSPTLPAASSDPGTSRSGDSSWSPALPAAPQPYAPQATLPEGSYAPTIPTSTSAIVSLVFGILGWVALPVIGPIIALIAGHMARGEIRRSNGAIQGGGLALAGLILGYIQVGLLLLGCVALVALLAIGALSGR